MCLYSYTDKPKKARRSIVCYKSVSAVAWNNFKDGYCSFESAFKHFIYKGGRSYYEPTFSMCEPGHLISEGFHSHATQKVAEDEVCTRGFGVNIILRCEIPAGAYYYKGGAPGMEDYCSDFIRITGWKTSGADEPWHDTLGPMCGRLRVHWVRIIYKLFSINKLE